MVIVSFIELPQKPVFGGKVLLDFNESTRHAGLASVSALAILGVAALFLLITRFVVRSAVGFFRLIIVGGLIGLALAAIPCAIIILVGLAGPGIGFLFAVAAFVFAIVAGRRWGWRWRVGSLFVSIFTIGVIIGLRGA